MFTNFDNTTLAIIEEARRYSLETFKLGKLGTESFLYVMFSDENSLCHLLLEEYRVSLEEIQALLNNYFIIRSKGSEYTEKLKEVFQLAKMVAIENGSSKVYEEHLFYALLAVKNTIFNDEICRLNLNQLNLLEDVKDYFNLVEMKEIDNYSTNLTDLAHKGKLNKLIGRESYLDRMEIILRRKNKNNVLLIGSAGVGKTALVEGLAQRLENQEIIALSIAGIIANTKYRGDFESRIKKILDEVSGSNTILFIDEIHTIMGAGGTDNNLDLANILKPYLARNNFRCIGATTVEEYQNYICKDKALTRRFQPVFVTETTIEETRAIITGIKDEFSLFHNVFIPEEIINYLLRLSQKIVNRKLPDKAIDLLDEALSIAKIKKAHKLIIEHIDLAFKNITGLTKGDIYYPYIYSEVEPYYVDHYLDSNDKNNLVTIEFNGDEANLDVLIEEMKKGFGILDEMVLDLDLSNFTEAHSIASLFGSPAGYIGYDEGGIISEHLVKYPAQIFVFRNINSSNSAIKQMLLKMLTEKDVYDKKGRKLNLKNSAFILTLPATQNHSLGFIDAEKKPKSQCALVLNNKVQDKKTDPYQDIFMNHGYFVSYNETDFNNHSLIYKKSFVDLLENYQAGSYELTINSQGDSVEITQNMKTLQ